MPTINYNYLAQFEPGTYHPVFDPTGLLPENLVTGEEHTITAVNGRDFHFIVPLFAPFFDTNLTLIYQPASGPSRALVEGIDYLKAFEFIGASRGCAKPVYGGISFLNNQLAGKVTLSYRTIGGNWCLSLPEITEILANRVNNPRVTAWEQVTNYPTLFPVIDHEWNLVDMVGMSKVVEGLEDIADAIAARPVTVLPVSLTDHLNDFDNPHEVTKAQVGLGLANNYATATNAEAMAGTATNLHMTPAGTKALVDLIQGDVLLELEAHLGDTANPHQVTKLQVGLGKVFNYDVATTLEAQQHVANDRYMTPARVWDELLFGFGAGLAASVSTLTASGTITAGGQIRAPAGAGAGATHGYSFSEVGFDTGMFSPGDNYIDFYSAGQLQMRMNQADGVIRAYKRIVSENQPLAMIQGDGTNNGALHCVAIGGGDGNLAGISFNNSTYAIKMGVRGDGYFGIGGWSRPAWSLYSDPSGNLVAAGNVTAYSDPRLKENRRLIADASKLLRQLTGEYFTWKHGIAHIACKAGVEDLGVMADKVKRVFPQIVYKSISLEGVEYDMVAYEKLVPVLVQGHNEHDVRIEALEKELAEARSMIESRDRAIARLGEQMAIVMKRLDKLTD